MKKIFAGIAATVLAAAMCVSFAACGGNGAEEAKDIEGKEVTAEQWTAAFEALTKEDAEYTITATSVMTYSIKNVTDPDDTDKKLSGERTLTTEAVYSQRGNREHQTTTSTAKLTGDARKIMEIKGVSENEIPKEDTTTETEEMYGEKTAAGYVLYKREGGKWTKGNGSSFSPASVFEGYQTKYENYTYSEEKKGYIPKGPSAEDGEELEVIKFDKDGKLVAICYEAPALSEEDHDGAEGTMTSVRNYLIEYSAEKIALPTAEEE